MFALMTKEPAKGFRAVSLQQVINADREMWLIAAQESRGKLLTDPSKPLDAVLEAAFKAPETSYHLLPLPGSSRDATPPTSTNDNNKREGPVKRPFKGGGGGPFKKGKGKGKTIDLPSGCVAETGGWAEDLFSVQSEKMQSPRQRQMPTWIACVLGQELWCKACSC